eukprot:CAMPEP_0170892024 /NCGR_PEP_ID=MMETSP0734-20130129/41365_1 /TAXON_ID=186038 /ORGANISM="Fragilariopsis kerguelensis, Strain L26-C5" /LENGTH=226 /DNA_ID=CAMNT_0011281821 /DNA_START=1371 /DNA_END=2049 /DNA_ORIENTATION=+
MTAGIEHLPSRFLKKRPPPCPPPPCPPMVMDYVATAGAVAATADSTTAQAQVDAQNPTQTITFTIPPTTTTTTTHNNLEDDMSTSINKLNTATTAAAATTAINTTTTKGTNASTTGTKNNQSNNAPLYYAMTHEQAITKAQQVMRDYKRPDRVEANKQRRLSQGMGIHNPPGINTFLAGRPLCQQTASGTVDVVGNGSGGTTTTAESIPQNSFGQLLADNGGEGEH